MVRVDVGGPQCAYVKDARRMSSIYQNMINLVFSIEIRGSLSCFVDIRVLEATMFYAAAKDTSLKPLSLVFSCRLCFPTVGPKIPKASAQPQYLRSYYAVRIRYSATPVLASYPGFTR